MLDASCDTILLILAALIALLTPYSALDLAWRARAARGLPRNAWLAAAAVAMGGGAWSMHFIAIMAFSPAIEISFHVGLTAASLAVAVMMSGASFLVVARPGAGKGAFGLGALLMALSVLAMNCAGLAATRLPGATYDLRLVAASMLVAFAASALAFAMYARSPLLTLRLAATAVLCCGTAAAHSIGVKAIDLAAPSTGAGAGAALPQPLSLAQPQLVLAVSATTVVVLVLGLAASLVDRRLAVMAEREAAALRLSEERFRALYRRAPVPLCAAIAGDVVEEVSDSWIALLGYQREDAVGRPVTDFMEPESADARGLLAGTWHRDSGVHEAEFRFVKRSGDVIDVALSCIAEHDASGAFVRTVEGLVDVTARKRAEDALRQSLKMEAVGQLTGGIAHDFNNLLMVITSNLELSQQHLARGAADRAARNVEAALLAAFRAASLTQRLLTFSRRQVLQPVAIDVGKLVTGTLALFHRALGENISLATSFAHGLWQTRADANQLENALINLAINARDAMPDGGTLTITAANAALPGSGEVAAGDYVRITVSDTGTGMPPSVLSRVFEPFFTTKGIGKGSGLGLSQVFGFVRQSGGDVRIASEPGRGTGIDLYLPRLADSGSPADSAPGMPVPPGARCGETILIVEDEEQVRECVGDILCDLGYLVLEAGNAEEALASLDGNPDIAVMLTDIGLPGMDGRTLARAALEKRPGLPVVFATGYARHAIEADAEPGMMVLNKPYRAQELADMIRRALDARPAA